MADPYDPNVDPVLARRRLEGQLAGAQADRLADVERNQFILNPEAALAYTGHPGAGQTGYDWQQEIKRADLQAQARRGDPTATFTAPASPAYEAAVATAQVNAGITPPRKDLAATTAGADAVVKEKAKADGVRDLLPSAEGTPDTSTLEVTRPPGVGPPPPPRAPIKAVRDPSTGKIVFTNIGTEGAGEPAGTVNYDDAIAKIRADQLAAPARASAADAFRGRLQSDPTQPGYETASYVPGGQIGQMADVVAQARRNIAEGRTGSASMVELGVGDNGDMTPAMREILNQRRTDALSELQARAQIADYNEKLRVLGLTPSERIAEQGRLQAAPAEAAGITPSYLQAQGDAIRRQAEAQIKANGQWAEYQRNPDKFEAAIQAQIRKSLAQDIETYLQGAGRGARVQQIPGLT